MQKNHSVKVHVSSQYKYKALNQRRRKILLTLMTAVLEETACRRHKGSGQGWENIYMGLLHDFRVTSLLRASVSFFP